MRKNLILSLFLLLISATILPAQACDFDQLIREGRAFLDKKKPEYRRALSKFNASRTCDPSKSAAVDKEVGRLFSMIEICNLIFVVPFCSGNMNYVVVNLIY